MATIVFACKSNSCRSQMAEGWAKKWIQSELSLLGGGEDGDNDVDGKEVDTMHTQQFLKGLMVMSVALDESSLIPTIPQQQLSSSPSSIIITDFDDIDTPSQCVTCCDSDDGEVCMSSTFNQSRRRPPPKEKAIEAMLQDGVDISSYYAKTFSDILPYILSNRKTDTMQHLPLLSGMRKLLERVTREMGKAFAGVGKEEKDDDARVVDSLIVLCSCPDYLKQRISDVSKVTMDWEIDAPTSLRLTEGDEAYLRVSRQIRDKVYNLLNELKEYALKEAG